MEEFDRINWNHPPETETSFVTSEVLKEKSLVYKILNSTFKSYQSSDSSDEPFEDDANKKSMPRKKKKNKKNKQNKQKTKSNSEENSAVNEDGVHCSAFTIAQHATFLEVLLAVQNQKGNIPTRFCEMKKEFEREQKDFQDYLKELWTTSFEKHSILHYDALKYTEDQWKLQLKRVKTYPQLYKMKKNIPLIYPFDNPEVQILPVKMLLEMGLVPKLHVPNVHLLPKLSTSYTQMLLLNAPKPEDLDTLQNKTVSLDKNAVHLALKEKANIVISSSGLKCIAGNVSSMFDKVWSIPVVIKEYKIKDGNSVKEHKIVFIDKKLPSKSMTAMQRNSLFHKHAVKSFLFYPRDPQSFRFPENEGMDMNIEIVDEESNNLCNPRNDENCSICKKCNLPPGEKTNCNNSNDEYDSDTESICSLVMDTDNEELKVDTGEIVNKKHTSTCTCKGERGIPEKVPESQCNNLPVAPSSKSNVTYRLWKMSCEERSREDLPEGLLKRPNLNQELKVLVRCKMDACENDNNKVRPVCVSSKMEYQAEYGVEKLHLSKLAKEWTSLFFRPEASLTRIHINAVTEEILMTEKSNLRDLTLLASSQYDTRIKRRILGSYYLVMSDLMTLKPGVYLMTHDVRNGPFISVLQQENENFTYDLYADYDLVNPSIFNKDNMPPWTPIDANIITPGHIAAKHVPATFEPRE